MRAYALLLDGLVYTQSRNRKLALLEQYFRTAPDPSRGWALASLTDGAGIKIPLRKILFELISSVTDPVLYKLSRGFVGDTAETAALLWPDNPLTAAPPLLEDVVAGLAGQPAATQREALRTHLNNLNATERWALLKFIGGAPRVGVSARLARTALAQAFAKDITEIEELWYALKPPYRDLFAWLEQRAPKPDISGKPVFRPVMLAYPIEKSDWPKLSPGDFFAEWKWDGVRVQVAARNGAVRTYSRHGEDVSEAFPEIQIALSGCDCVIDGELLIVRENTISAFNDLQQRLNRKKVTSSHLSAYPAHVRVYDMLFDGNRDLRPLPLIDRRHNLEQWYGRQTIPLVTLSELIAFESFSDLELHWAAARDNGIEGLMLKRKLGPYVAGRVKGEWYKWKRASLTLDCVLMYAQRGSGKRSSFYSDYTFGLWRRGQGQGVELVPVGIAYSGFSDDELKQLDRWVRSHTVESFGPVRSVEQKLVLEVAFDAVQISRRHKSGVAMRFPRIHRIRWDKPAGEADTLEAILRLIAENSDQSVPYADARPMTQE